MSSHINANNSLPPLWIEFLLQCHYAPGSEIASVQRNAARYFESKGAITPSGRPDSYQATDLGRAWAMAICSTPRPQVIYLDRAGQTIDGVSESEPKSATIHSIGENNENAN